MFIGSCYFIKMINVDFVTVTYNSEEVIAGLLESVESFFDVGEISWYVVDNDSRDSTCEIVENRFPWVKLVRSNENLGFSGGNNVVLPDLCREFVSFVNPDVRFLSSIEFTSVSKCLETPGVGMIAGRLLNDDGTSQFSVRKFPSLWYFILRGVGLDGRRPFEYFTRSFRMDGFDWEVEQDVDWAIGAFLILKRSVFVDLLNGFDESYFMYYEDADLALRLRGKNLKVVYSPVFYARHLYKRESSRQVFSKLKFIHVVSFFKFYMRLQRWRLKSIFSRVFFC